MELAGRIALVTGASRGIGAAAAIELARRGAHVVITARNQGGLAETDDAIRAETDDAIRAETDDAIRAIGGQATLLPLDLLAEGGLEAIGPSLYQRFGKLDILVGNAGALGTLTPVPHILLDDWAETVGVNVTATLRLLRSVAPLLLAAEAGRAVFVTSNIVRKPAAYWGTYGATKAALEHLILTWAEETRTARLRVNLFDPGVVATKLRAAAMPGEDPSALRQPAEVAPDLVDLCGPNETRHGAVVRIGS